MQFTFTKTYPDEIPLIEVAQSDGIAENDEEELLNHLREEVFLSNYDRKLILAFGSHFCTIDSFKFSENTANSLLQNLLRIFI